MILASDIGNTTIAIGLCKGDRLALKGRLPTKDFKQFKSFLKNILKKRNVAPSKLESAVICSVVPKINREIKNAIRGIVDIPIYLLGENLTVPIKNLYARPRQVGQDRLVCAYTAMKLYGAPVINVDLGTAITFDLVSKNREYLGGIILPGLHLSLSALHRQTALLPEIKLVKPKTLIGKDTPGSMLSGVTFGFGSMIDGLIEKLKKELKDNPKVIATGGDCLFIKPYCRKVDYFEPDLILKGMAELAGKKRLDK